jgi:hypothetical protein
MYGSGQKFEENGGLMRASSFGFFVFFLYIFVKKPKEWEGMGGVLCVYGTIWTL